MSSQQFLDIVKARRSIYTLKKESTISDEKIQDIINQALLHVPSSFNSQSTRIILLLKEEHNKMWDITKSALKAAISKEQYPITEKKLNGLQAGYGTILFFDDRTTIKEFQTNKPTYSDKFPGWAIQSNGMTQFAIWTALAAEGLGVNLQHYNPLIDEKVREEWNIPKEWEFNAQMVFGTPYAQPGEKTFMDVKERFRVYGA